MGVLKITRGPRPGAVRAVIYGTEGIGKSTLAAQFPAPLILDTEDGTRQLDCAVAEIKDWKTLTLAISELAVDPQGFRTVVIDSADWAERILVESMLAASGKKSIEDYGFGKGYVLLQEHIGRFLAKCDDLIAAGMNVVFVAHSAVKRTSPPDMTDGFDRYELKLTKQVAPLLKEWADLLLFCNYRTSIVEGADGRKKAAGGKERLMHTERTASWDAKNRFGLPATLPMSIASLAPVFGKPSPPPVKSADVEEPEDAPPTVAEIVGHIRSAKTVKALGRMGDRIDEMASEGHLTDLEVAELMGAINARHQEIEPTTQEAVTNG